MGNNDTLIFVTLMLSIGAMTIITNAHLSLMQDDLSEQIATFQSWQEYQLTEMNNSISVMAEVLYDKK